MQPQPMSAPRRSRVTRWMIGLALLAVLLTAYGLGLAWFTQRLENDLQKSLRALPVDGQPAARAD